MNAVQLRLVISVRILSWCQSAPNVVVPIFTFVILELMNAVVPFLALLLGVSEVSFVYPLLPPAAEPTMIFSRLLVLQIINLIAF